MLIQLNIGVEIIFCNFGTGWKMMRMCCLNMGLR